MLYDITDSKFPAQREVEAIDHFIMTSSRFMTLQYRQSSDDSGENDPESCQPAQFHPGAVIVLTLGTFPSTRLLIRPQGCQILQLGRFVSPAQICWGFCEKLRRFYCVIRRLFSCSRVS